MQPSRHAKRWLLASIAALVFVAFTGAAPTYHTSSGCLFCGSHRVEQWWLGLKWWDSIRDNDCANWVRAMHPGHSNHIWATSSIMRKDWGFGSKTVGCAIGAGYLISLYTLRSHFGEERTRQLLARYHSELNGSRDSFHRYLRTELRPILTNAVPATIDGAM